MQKAYWKIRSKNYNFLNAMVDSAYIEAFISSTDFSKKDVVLDVGTGTGIIANALAPLVKEVIGLDISQEMMERNKWIANTYFLKGDIRDSIFFEGVFDKVTARLVFHHIIKKTQKAMDECYRVLKKGGKMVLSENVPPTPQIKDEFTRIFSLKEERLVFLENDLIKLMENSGFKNIETFVHVQKNFSVKNWLGNSGLSQEKQDKIFEMHITGSNVFKQAYSLKLLNDDCLINVKYLILVGEKE